MPHSSLTPTTNGGELSALL